MTAILVLNAGSSSLKVAVFDGDELLDEASVEEIGGTARLSSGSEKVPVAASDHASALEHILSTLATRGLWPDRIAAAGHRVVHGGTIFDGPCRISPEVLCDIEKLNPLAPLHNPVNLAGIYALAELAPEMPQVACFDTAFHRSIPEKEARYALPAEAEALGLRRYGFHGLSYSALVERLPQVSGGKLPSRLLACHLGNGSSLCAIKNGRSVATTMGYSPLEGLTMGTRSGSIDGNAVLRLAEEMGLERAGDILNRASGLKGLSGGISDMRVLAGAGGDMADFAIEHFCHSVIRNAGAMVASMGGLDAVAFTGGIGENSADIREQICAGLTFLGVRIDTHANSDNAMGLHLSDAEVGVWIVPAAEEWTIARLTASCLA
ncbi:MAG: acetate/propionate family kinase [Pseudomonadota bacterium]